MLLETRHVKAALSAVTVKTHHKDLRGIAQLLRTGWYVEKGPTISAPSLITLREIHLLGYPDSVAIWHLEVLYACPLSGM
ncbi:hypothetical protein I6F15_30230 [Bradyrhizobium sp. BRP14]|nr:hypothetical protein [Bradyrhizobium sp. BRP14]